MAQRNRNHGRPRHRRQSDRPWSQVEYDLAAQKKAARARARRERDRPGQLEIGDLLAEDQA